MWSITIVFFLFVMRSRSAEASNDWNYLMFSQSWPATVCRVWMEKNPSHTCTFPKARDAWSIHGIWPSVSGSSGPVFCNRTAIFDPKEIKPIESELKQGWINVEDGTPQYALWAHEWNKHGTCAASIETLDSQIKYFSQGLAWLRNYTMTTILSEANIKPSDTKTYTQNVFYKAVKNKLGVDLDINCLHKGDKQYLWELRICFSKSFDLIDCKSGDQKLYVNDVNFISNCDSGGVIFSSDPSKMS